MWYSKLKYQKIRILMKANHKKLKVFLASEVKKFGLTFLALNLGKFPLFDSFFLDLDNF